MPKGSVAQAAAGQTSAYIGPGAIDGFEQIKQYPGEKQKRLKVLVDIPGSRSGAGQLGGLSGAERRENYQAQAVDFETDGTSRST